MHLEWLKFFHFRNLADQTIDLSPNLNFIVGANGQGKTNLVEAVYLLSTAKSFRTSNVEEIIRWEEREASVFASVRPDGDKADEPPYEIGFILTKGGKEAYLQGQKTRSLSEILGKLSSVSFTPTDIALVKGAPQIRRKFLDRYMADSDPALLPALLSYQKSLRNKNQLLRAPSPDIRQLEAWECVMSEAAIQIEAARKHFLERLELAANLEMRSIAESDGQLKLTLVSNIHTGKVSSAADLKELFTQNRDRELRAGSCIIGPHQDDVSITLNAQDTRAFASQGQARSVTLAIKLGVVQLLEADKGQTPVILLDDFDSELDKERREAVMNLVLKPRRQVFISTTSLQPFETVAKPPRKLMLVRSGIVESL